MNRASYTGAATVPAHNRLQAVAGDGGDYGRLKVIHELEAMTLWIEPVNSRAMTVHPL